MRRLLIALFILLLSVAAALWFKEQAGYVLITVGRVTLETSLVFFLGVLAAFILVSYLLISVLRRLWRVPGGMRHWAGERRRSRGRKEMTAGLIKLAEGNWLESERLLTHNVDNSDVPLLHYLAAAVAAQRRGSFDDRDRYLALADRSSRKARLAVGLIQGQLQMESQQWEQALATLSYLHDSAPRHERVLRMLMESCLKLNEWDRLRQLLPELRKQGIVGDERARELETEIGLRRLERAVEQSASALQQVWESVPRAIREQQSLALVYLDGLLRWRQGEEAERFIKTRLQREWDASLAARYPDLAALMPAERLFATVEKWLKERPEDGGLLYAAGRLALSNRLWGRARSYLEASLARGGGTAVRQTLAALLEFLGEKDAAREMYRDAAVAATGLPLPKELRGTPEALPSAASRPGTDATGPVRAD